MSTPLGGSNRLPEVKERPRPAWMLGGPRVARPSPEPVALRLGTHGHGHRRVAMVPRSEVAIRAALALRPMCAAEVAHESQLSKESVRRVLELMCDQGLVVVVGTVRGSQRGPKARCYAMVRS